MKTGEKILQKIFAIVVILCMILNTVPQAFIQVSAAAVKAKKIQINYSTCTISVGKTKTLKATVTPANAANKILLWTSSNKNIVAVSNKGVIKGINKGNATITVKVKNTTIKAIAKVTVTAKVVEVNTGNKSSNINEETKSESEVNTKEAEKIWADWDKQFLASNTNRVNEILNSKTTIIKSDSYIPGSTYSGTAYYVSNKGNDNNDGTSKETAWATIDKVNWADLKNGDAVFFERGGIWREELHCKVGVTYSAYGSGDKPCIYGSQENGAGADKWKIWYEGANGEKIWVYHTDVSDCGGIVLNDGASYASRVYSYWDGSKYVFVDNLSEPFDIKTGLKNDLQFYSYCDLTGYSKPIYVYNIDSRGKLYLRCDKGNPGEIYKSIEFQTAPKPEAGYCGLIKAEADTDGGSVIDNLCVKYGISRGISTHHASNILIQNCEVAWIGGGSHEYNENRYVPVSGEGIGAEGSNNTVKNCYVHDCFDGGVICELDANESRYVENITIEGNTIERCMSGVLIASHSEDVNGKPVFGNLKVKNNYILYSGYGWSCDKNYNFTWGDDNYMGNTITFWDNPNINNGIYVTDNVFYISKSSLIHLGMDRKYMPVMSGNTYVQNADGVVIRWSAERITMDPNPVYTKQYINDSMGDKTAIVIPKV